MYHDFIVDLFITHDLFSYCQFRSLYRLVSSVVDYPFHSIPFFPFSVLPL